MLAYSLHGDVVAACRAAERAKGMCAISKHHSPTVEQMAQVLHRLCWSFGASVSCQHDIKCPLHEGMLLL